MAAAEGSHGALLKKKNAEGSLGALSSKQDKIGQSIAGRMRFHLPPVILGREAGDHAPHGRADHRKDQSHNKHNQKANLFNAAMFDDVAYKD